MYTLIVILLNLLKYINSYKKNPSFEAWRQKKQNNVGRRIKNIPKYTIPYQLYRKSPNLTAPIWPVLLPMCTGLLGGDSGERTVRPQSTAGRWPVRSQLFPYGVQVSQLVSRCSVLSSVPLW